MKRLYLLRHAKSSWDDLSLTDIDRPLSARGRKAAPLMGHYMREAQWVPARALCSPARRAQETWNQAVSSLDHDVPETLLPGLYHAGPEEIMRILNGLESDCQSVILVGHNPGLAMLATALAGDVDAEARIGKFPTAALAVLDLDIDAWPEAKQGCGRLVAFVRPRDFGAS